MTTVITMLDHVQLAIPPGSEDRCRPFYVGLLGMTEVSVGGGAETAWSDTGEPATKTPPAGVTVSVPVAVPAVAGAWYCR